LFGEDLLGANWHADAVVITVEGCGVFQWR
jgi:hypothetical protein